MHIFLNGKFLPSDQAKISPFDHGFLYGDGVYETLRTYNGKIWQPKEHLKRLQASAKTLKLKLPYPTQKIETYAKKLVQLNGFTETRLRITLTRGENQGDFMSCKKPTLLITATQLKPEPKNVYTKGVKLVSLKITRLLPKIKSTNLLPFIIAQQEKNRRKAYETIFITPKNHVTEGSITNVFMVKNGLLITPKSNILKGTTRTAILNLTRNLGIKTSIKDFTLNVLRTADEIFITNAPRGIIPVQQIDGKIIGNGKPGPITKKIMAAFKNIL